MSHIHRLSPSFSVCVHRRSLSSSTRLRAHLPSVALKWAKNNKTLNSAFDHSFFLPSQLLGAAVLFVQAYHIKASGQGAKKEGRKNPTQILAENIEQSENVRREAPLRNRSQ